MASGFDCVAGFDVVGRYADSLQPCATRCLESPHLGLAFLILDFEVYPGMRDNQVHFFDDTLDVHKRVDVIAMGMVGPRGQNESSCTNCQETKIYFESHAYLL